MIQQLMFKSNFINETGKKYGSLTVLEPIRRKQDRKTMWKCQCDCGNIIICSGSDLRSNKRTSCGKHCNNIKKEAPGTIYGFLKILKQDPTPAKNYADKCIHWICECLNCGNIVSISGKNLRNGDTCSCGYIKSKGELYIIQYLKENNIKFIYQQSFPDLTSQYNNKLLQFDFGIYQNNQLDYLIEFNGNQHFKQISYFGNKLEDIQFNDLKKEQYCKEHDYFLLKINMITTNKITKNLISQIFTTYQKEKNNNDKIFNFNI